jgi:hypothetical protein
MITARNTDRYTALLTAVSIFALVGMTIPSQAGSPGGVVGGAVGSVSGAVGAVGGTGGTLSGTGGVVSGTGGLVGGAVSSISGTVDGIDGTTTTATVGALTNKGVLDASVRSDLIGGIKAKLNVLSKKQLVKLCIGIGGGSGCGSGHSRHQLLGLIDARLTLLSNKRLLGLCVSVGGTGCGGATGGLATIAKIGVLDHKGVLHGTVKSDLILDIKAKLDVLSNKNLAKLCVGIGGGTGCGSGHSRHQLLGLIDYKLTLLSKKELLGLCVSVGGTGCGSFASTGVGGTVGTVRGAVGTVSGAVRTVSGIGGGGSGNGGGGSGNAGGGSGNGNGGAGQGIVKELAGLNSGERRELKRKCPAVLYNPAAYSSDAVRVCRVLAQLAIQ